MDREEDKQGQGVEKGRIKEEEEKDLINPVFKLELNCTKIFVGKKVDIVILFKFRKEQINKGNALF